MPDQAHTEVRISLSCLSCWRFMRPNKQTAMITWHSSSRHLQLSTCVHMQGQAAGQRGHPGGAFETNQDGGCGNCTSRCKMRHSSSRQLQLTPSAYAGASGRTVWTSRGSACGNSGWRSDRPRRTPRHPLPSTERVPQPATRFPDFRISEFDFNISNKPAGRNKAALMPAAHAALQGLLEQLQVLLWFLQNSRAVGLACAAQDACRRVLR